MQRPEVNEKAKKIKVKKKRVIPPARWTESATEHLLQLTCYELRKNPNAFEATMTIHKQKPTAQRFYSKISTKSYHLRKTSWISMKNKLRHLKIHYMRARKLLHFADNKGDTGFLNKICPYYDILHKIFGVHLKRDNNNLNNKSSEGEFKGFGQWDVRNGGGYTQVGAESTQTSLTSSEFIEKVSRLEAVPNSSHSSSMPNLHTAGTLLGKSKLKRKHEFEWTEPASEFLLKLILEEVQNNPGTFEKPTRPAFYKKISASCRQLKDASWISMKRKLRNLHMDYLKAKIWSRESNINQDQQVIAGEQSITNSANEQKFSSVNFWVNDGFDVSVRESGLQQCVSEATFIETPEKTDDMDIEKLENEDVGCSHFGSNSTLGFVERSQSFPVYPEELLVSTQDIQPPKLSSHGIGTNTCFSCLAFERKKLEVEHQKLQLEQKKFEWQQEKEGAELQLKQRELENQFELKSLELAKEERMEKAKLQLEHQEKIKKYEMKMKINHFKRSSGHYNPHS
uniref:Myb/SANT-like DNA-binding domain-containing protein n=1 Tax=Glossina palpalis gambiensis TaxID=67801 RepID=A0A1B0BKZ9_9MUSC